MEVEGATSPPQSVDRHMALHNAGDADYRPGVELDGMLVGRFLAFTQRLIHTSSLSGEMFCK